MCVYIYRYCIYVFIYIYMHTQMWNTHAYTCCRSTLPKAVGCCHVNAHNSTNPCWADIKKKSLCCKFCSIKISSVTPHCGQGPGIVTQRTLPPSLRWVSVALWVVIYLSSVSTNCCHIHTFIKARGGSCRDCPILQQPLLGQRGVCAFPLASVCETDTVRALQKGQRGFISN